MLKKLIQNLFWIIVFSCTSHSSLFWTYFQLYVHITWPESNLNPNLHICGLFDTSLGLCVMEIIQNSTRMWGPKGKNMLSQVICPWEHETILHFKSQKSFFFHPSNHNSTSVGFFFTEPNLRKSSSLSESVFMMKTMEKRHPVSSVRL